VNREPSLRSALVSASWRQGNALRVSREVKSVSRRLLLAFLLEVPVPLSSLCVLGNGGSAKVHSRELLLPPRYLGVVTWNARV